MRRAFPARACPRFGRGGRCGTRRRIGAGRHVAPGDLDHVVDRIGLGCGEIDRGPALVAPAAGHGGAEPRLGLRQHGLLAARQLDDGAPGLRQGEEDAPAHPEVALAEMGTFLRAGHGQRHLDEVFGCHD